MSASFSVQDVSSSEPTTTRAAFGGASDLSSKASCVCIIALLSAGVPANVQLQSHASYYVSAEPSCRSRRPTHGTLTENVEII